MLRACVPGGAADGVGAARPGACGSPVAASRCALGDDGVGAARPGACMSPPPSRARCLYVSRQPGHRNIGRRSCRSALGYPLADGVVRRLQRWYYRG